MSNTAVSTLFQKYLSQHSTINTQSPFGDKEKNPRRIPSLGPSAGALIYGY